MTDASDIYQAALDAAGNALFAGDFDAYRIHYTLPHVAETFEQSLRIDTETALRTLFESLRRNIKESGVSRFDRTCTTAAFKDETTLHAAHESILVGPDGPATPYPNLGEMRRINGDWRFSRLQSAVDPAHVLSRSICQAQNRQLGEAKTILQDVLDAHTAALFEGDGAALSKVCALPYILHVTGGRIVFDRYDGPFTDTTRVFSEALHNMGIERFVRVALEGHFVTPDRIEGRFRNYYLRGNVDLYPSYEGEVVLIRDGDRFRVSEATNNKAAENWTMLSPYLPKVIPTVSDADTGNAAG